jgi:hypothetical protein
MIQSQEMSGEEKSVLSDQVDDSLGISDDPVENTESNESNEPSELPEYAKKKLGMQEKRHKKEIKRLQQQLNDVQSRVGSYQEPKYPEQQFQGNSSNSQHEDPVYAAVARALQLQKEQEQKAKEAEQMQHLSKQYKAWQDHLDNESDKYEDFDEVVNSDDSPYTGVMRDMSVILHGIPGINSAEVLYRLGKDKDKLRELSKKTPVEQSREVLKLAIALSNGGNKSTQSSGKTLSSIKNSPLSNTNINENTSVGDLRKKMRDNGKKWGR